MPAPDDAIAYAKRFIGNLTVDDSTIKLRLLDDSHRKLWMAAPWSWTLGALEVVSLTNDAQDVSLSGAYTDLLGLVDVVMFGQGGKETPIPLAPAANLPVTTAIKGQPSKVQYISGSPNKLRLLPIPTGYSSAPTLQIPKITGTYKKKATAIDNTTTADEYSTLGIPDDWFWVYQEIVLLKAFQFTHDPRLGSAQVGPNGIVYTGQYAIVEAGIAEMRRNEEKLFGPLGEVINA